MKMQTVNNVVNPVDQTTKHESRSDKYSLINTRALINIAEQQGFKVASIRYPNRGKNAAHRLHEVRLDLPGYETLNTKSERPQLILHNSHDGTSSIRIMAGVFRLVCSNGLVAGKTTLNIRLRHVGLIQQDVEESLKIAAQQAKSLAGAVDKLKTVQLTEEKQQAYIKDALIIRSEFAGLSRNEQTSLVNPVHGNSELLDRVRRFEDQGNGLWELFNRTQEKLVRASGLRYVGDDGKYHRLYGVNSIKANTDFNQALWELTERYSNAA